MRPMRLITAGLLFFSLATTALAQAKGEVESIGFGGLYRPDAWTPMLIHLRPTGFEAWAGKLEVIQDDLDKDHVIFSRDIDLSPSIEGESPRDQYCWMYFIPRPNGFESSNRSYLTQNLQVLLCSKDGKQLSQLEVTCGLQSLDESGGMAGSMFHRRGCKLALFVCTPQSNIVLDDAYARTMGLNEDVCRISVPEAKLRTILPENVIGYESVDAIIWSDADPRSLNDDQRAALEQYVRRGGRLVVLQCCRLDRWKTISDGLANLLPVQVQSVEFEKELAGLRKITDEAMIHVEAMDARATRPVWPMAGGPFAIARAKIKAGVVGAWDADLPYIVRGSFGQGSVTWVAQDLGDRAIVGNGSDSGKWVHVWDRVFDWPNDSIPAKSEQREEPFSPVEVAKYGGGDKAADLSYSMISAMELPGRGAALLGIAILFFVAYWALAGPGCDLFLGRRKQTSWRWFAFAAVALVATGITLLIVKLVLHGQPRLHHVSYVRIAPGEDALVRSDFGLYVPQDGYRSLTLGNTDAGGGASFLSAYPLHLRRGLGASEGFVSASDYELPVFHAQTLSVFYRSTMKKMQACWAGKLPGIEGRARLGLREKLLGILTNKCGFDLRNVYFVFHYPRGHYRDEVFYLPGWKKDVYFNLQAEFPANIEETNLLDQQTPAGRREPGFSNPMKIVGDIGRRGSGGWDTYWYRNYSKSTITGAFEDRSDVPQAFPMLSLFDRLPVMPNSDSDKRQPNPEADRCEMSRYGARWMDVSAAISAGELVILAEVDDVPLPFPLRVDGDIIGGSGVAYYQFIVPLDCRAVEDSVVPSSTTRSH